MPVSSALGWRLCNVLVRQLPKFRHRCRGRATLGPPVYRRRCAARFNSNARNSRGGRRCDAPHVATRRGHLVGRPSRCRGLRDSAAPPRDHAAVLLRNQGLLHDRHPACLCALDDLRLRIVRTRPMGACHSSRSIWLLESFSLSGLFRAGLTNILVEKRDLVISGFPQCRWSFDRRFGLQPISLQPRPRRRSLVLANRPTH